MTDTPAEWACRVFCDRANLVYELVLASNEGSGVALRSAVRAGGLLIEQTEKPPVDPDVLVVRAILHAHQRAMGPPDSGWGDMSYARGSYDDLPTFQAALGAYRALRS